MERVKKKNALLMEMVDSFNQSGVASIQQTVSSIIRIINDPDATIKDLQDIIEVDPPLAFNLLKVANSAVYSARQPVTRISEAVLRIGFEALKEIALSQKLFEMFNDEVEYRGFSRASLWKHSVAVALLGKMIFRMEFREKGDNIYAAGLLHDIGLISEDQTKHRLLEKAIEVSMEEAIDLSEAENRILGFNHADLAYAIAKSWRLPDELVNALGYHHTPDAAPRAYSKMVMVLYVADYLCQENEIGYCDSPYNDQKIYQNCLKRLNMEPYMLELIFNDMQTKLREMDNMRSI